MNKNLFAFLIIVFSFSCSEDNQTYSIGDVFNDPNATIDFVDTLTINASTVLLDSFVTSGYNKVFVGYHENEYSGKLRAQSYIPFGFDDLFPSFSDEANFDSLVLVLVQNTEYFGDTLVSNSISVHRVTEKMEPSDDGYYYNNWHFIYDEASIGSKSFFSKPHSTDKIFIKLTDALGQEWFNKIMDNDEDMASTDALLNYFSGITIVPQNKETSWSASFYGKDLSGEEDDELVNEIQIRIYYSEPNEEENQYYSFIPTSNLDLFMELSSDRTGSVLENLNHENNILPSDQTDNLLFLQSGAGIVTKIDIPGIDRLYNLNENISVIDAELVFIPCKGSYSELNPLPESIHFYWTDKKNRLNGTLTDVTGLTNETAALNFDHEFNENTYYEASILNYVMIELAREEETDDDLMLLFSGMDYATSFKKLIIQDQSLSKNSLKLKLHYITY